ncbi:MAG TPA: class I SAM-dependent methyltransferase [Terriglobales bacterium]|nr:class I SAM-dependent methyltransferase [Terriglobales bacterium]
MREVLDHYETTPEKDRLQSGWGVLELARTQELILRHLPPPPGRILDIGGGTGVYSHWLAERGYEVHFLDLVPAQVEQVRQNPGRIASIVVGDAQSLAQPDHAFNAVLLLGPLYHLTERRARLKALAEARRVLRPSGVLFASAISHFASLLDSLVSGFIDDPQFLPIVQQDLRDGQHRNSTGNPLYFTTAFFHRPEELREEILAAGLAAVELAAIEGPGWLAKDFAQRWADESRRRQLLEWVRKVEHEPALMGLSLHLLAVAKHP